MPRERRRRFRRRTPRPDGTAGSSYTTKDYIQFAIVILVIAGILATALMITSQF